MNRFKKYCRENLGILGDNDYPCMPYEISPGIYLDSVHISAERCSVVEVYNVDRSCRVVNRDGSVTTLY